MKYAMKNKTRKTWDVRGWIAPDNITSHFPFMLEPISSASSYPVFLLSMAEQVSREVTLYSSPEFSQRSQQVSIKSYSLCSTEALWGFPVVSAADLHVLPSFAVLCQSTIFVRKGGVSGLISFAACSWKRILRPPDLGLPCVGWYRAYLEIRSPWGCRRQWPRNLICRAFNNWLGKRDCSLSILDFLVANVISTRNAKYDSKARRLEGINLTT